MHLKEYPDWHAVVAAHWRKTQAFLLAFREPCIGIVRDELAAIKKNRVLVGLDASRLDAWTPGDSWFLAVILCPGDDITALVAWLGDHQADATRVHFYAHPDTDAFAALRPWAEAALGQPAVDEDVDSWERLHKRFGNDLSVRILADWG